MERRIRLVPVPVPLLELAGAMIGHRAEVRRLCSSLVVDAVPTRNDLAWSPPVEVDEALRRTARWYHSEGAVHGG
jgi:hypothetical protein